MSEGTKPASHVLEVQNVVLRSGLPNVGEDNQGDPVRTEETLFQLAFNIIQARAHQNANEKGFWKNEFNIAEKICLMHSELSEAMESARRGIGAPSDKIETTGLEEEFADVIIRIMDLSEYLGLDIADAVTKKMVYNAGREYKHGKEF